MSWMEYSKMKEEADKNTDAALKKIKNNYSIDEEGKLVIAQWTKTEKTGKTGLKRDRFLRGYRTWTFSFSKATQAVSPTW